MITTPDLERLLPPILYQGLAADWQGIYVGRNKPAAAHSYVVTLHKAGGVAKLRILDHVRMAVNVWAPSDAQANDLAELVRAHLEALHGVSPFKSVTASVPSPVVAKGEPPQRFLIADVSVRREIH